MRSNAGMANRQGTSTCAFHKSPPPLQLELCLGLAWCSGCDRNLKSGTHLNRVAGGIIVAVDMLSFKLR